MPLQFPTWRSSGRVSSSSAPGGAFSEHWLHLIDRVSYLREPLSALLCNPVSYLRRSGKSSIAKVVFSKMAPHETLFLEPSTALRVYTIATNPYMQFSIWDWPGDYEWARGAASHAGSTSLGASYMGSASMPGGSLLGASLAHSMGVGSMASRAGTSTGSHRDAVSLAGTLNAVVFEDPQDELDQGMPGAQPLDVQALSELEALYACSAIIFVIDAADEPPYSDAIEALRKLAVALIALAKKKAAAAALSRAAGPAAAAAAAASSGSHTGIPGSTPTNPYALPSLEIFLHKIDGDAFASAGPEARTELLRDVGSQVGQELSDAGFAVSGIPSAGFHSRETSHPHGVRGIPMGSGGIAAAPGVITGPVPLSVAFHLTSIHDHSIYEALSRVVQKVTPGPQLMPSCENLLNGLQAAVGAEKVFLLDVVTKLYYASDSNPVQESTYELCSAMIEVVNDVSAIYDPSHAAEAAAAAGLPAPLGIGSGESLAEALGRKTPPPGGVADSRALTTPDDAGRCSISLIRLSDGTGLYMREVSPNLGIVAVIRDREPEGWEEDAGTLRAPSDSEVDLGDLAGTSLGGGGLGGGAGFGSGRSEGEAVGAGGGGRAHGAAYIPRSGLSFPDRALVDYNIRVFAGALAKVFALRLGIGARELAAAGAFLPMSMAKAGGVSVVGPGSSLMPAGSYGGLPLSSSLSKSSYQGASMMARSYSGGAGGGAAAASYSPAIMIGGGGAGAGGSGHGGYREPVSAGGASMGAEIEFGSPKRVGLTGAELMMASRGR